MLPASVGEVLFRGVWGIVWASSFPCCSACSGYVPVTEVSSLCFWAKKLSYLNNCVSRKTSSWQPTKSQVKWRLCHSQRTAVTLSLLEIDTSSSGTWMTAKPLRWEKVHQGQAVSRRFHFPAAWILPQWAVGSESSLILWGFKDRPPPLALKSQCPYGLVAPKACLILHWCGGTAPGVV